MEQYIPIDETPDQKLWRYERNASKNATKESTTREVLESAGFSDDEVEAHVEKLSFLPECESDDLDWKPEDTQQ